MLESDLLIGDFMLFLDRRYLSLSDILVFHIEMSNKMKESVYLQRKQHIKY